MKSTFISFIVTFLFLSSFSFAQLKIGYVDSDTILDNSPDMQEVRQKIDALVQEWQTELRKMETELKAKQDDYEKRKLIMTEETSADALAEIKKQEKEIADYRDIISETRRTNETSPEQNFEYYSGFGQGRRA